VSVVTRCPSCATTFRATTAQLEARGGLVRCGHCGHAFNAHGAIVAASEPSKQPQTPASPQSTSGAEQQSGRVSTRPGIPSEINFGPTPRPPASRLWWPAAALALLVLGAQLTFYFRGDIVVLWPDAKPIFIRACASLDCEVPLPRHAELLSIEVSDLQANPSVSGVMVLSATLRNRAAFAQQFPALELTLTNAQEEVVARRVLAGKDYLERGASLQAGFAGNTEVAIKVFFEAATLTPAGYRLYLFYP
jgi:predicted Zn finger-like uncharacterized protein